MKKSNYLLGIVALSIGVACSASAATTTITQFLPNVVTHVAGQWYQSDVRTGGTASIVSLSGLGGVLESGQPLPTGAAKLTTDMTNAAKAEVGTFGDFGLASTTLSDISLGYNYYKQSVSGGNAFTAPSLKLQIYAAGGSGDNYGNLVYEPTWNIGAGSVAVPTNAWQSVSINSSTGSGATSAGGWWWDGGFNLPNGAGGTPIRSLSEWITAFQAADASDFAGAHVVGLSMGVGSYNQGQIGYFDNVSIKSVAGGVNAVYDFQTTPAVPEPMSIMLGLMGLGSIAGFKKLRK